MDISQLTHDLLQGLGVIVLAMAMVGGRVALSWMDLKLTADQASTLNVIAGHALDWAIAKASDRIASNGWDHPDVKSGILHAALIYAQENAATGLKRSGIDTRNRMASADALVPVLERSFAGAMGRAAASPSTPAAPAASSLPIPVHVVGNPVPAPKL